MQYQFEEPFIVDSSKITTLESPPHPSSGPRPTPSPRTPTTPTPTRAPKSQPDTTDPNGIPMTHAVVPHPLTTAEEAVLPPPARQPRVRRRLVLIVLAVVVFVAAVLVLGMHGLIPFGLLLAFSADSDEEEARRSVILTRRNLGLAAAMVAAFVWFWLWHLDLPQSTLVLIAGALIALPLALQESAGDAARDRTIVVTKRSLILALWGLVVFIFLYYAARV